MIEAALSSWSPQLPAQWQVPYGLHEAPLTTFYFGDLRSETCHSAIGTIAFRRQSVFKSAIRHIVSRWSLNGCILKW